MVAHPEVVNGIKTSARIIERLIALTRLVAYAYLILLVLDFFTWSSFYGYFFFDPLYAFMFSLPARPMDSLWLFPIAIVLILFPAQLYKRDNFIDGTSVQTRSLRVWKVVTAIGALGMVAPIAFVYALCWGQTGCGIGFFFLLPTYFVSIPLLAIGLIGLMVSSLVGRK